jgi:membrane protein
MKVWQLTQRTVSAYSSDGCSLMAAAISYYVLFSIIPLTIFAVSIFGLVVVDDQIQEDVSEKVIEYLDVQAGAPLIAANAEAIDAKYGPGTADRLQQDIGNLSDEQKQQIASSLDRGENVDLGGLSLNKDEIDARPDNAIVDTVNGVAKASAALTLVGLVGTMWSASAMFGAIRRALNIAFGVQSARPLVRQKLVDLAMVLGVVVLLFASIASTATLRALQELSDKSLGPLSPGSGFFWSTVPYMLPAALSFLVFVFLYRFVPEVKHSFKEVLPGAIFGTVLFELLKNGFALYVAKFNNFAGAYGALGGILLFMLWTYLSASILLLGAELSVQYGKLRRGELAAGPSRPIMEQVRWFLRGLVFRQPEGRGDRAEEANPRRSAIERRKQ